MKIPVSFYNEIIVHAREGKPSEVCGLIAGKDGSAVKLWRTTNNDRTPKVRYNVEPLELLRVLREIESNGWTLLAIYHSHPATEAYPSATDVGLAYYPETVYIIVSLAGQTEAVPERGWRAVLLPYAASAVWGTTALAVTGLVNRLGRRAMSPLGMTDCTWGGGPLRFLRRPPGLAAMLAASAAIGAMMRGRRSIGPTVRAFKIVNGKVNAEPLLVEQHSRLETVIERNPVDERTRL